MNNPDQEMQLLLGEVLPFAKKMLIEHGEFYPFGAVLDADRKISHVGARIEGTEHPMPAELMTSLRDHFIEGMRSGRYVATALAADVKVTPPGGTRKVDAVRVKLDHASHESIYVLHCYSLKDGTLTFGTTFSVSTSESDTA